MAASETATGAKIASNYRWSICALLFAITTINYMDRNILGVLDATGNNYTVVFFACASVYMIATGLVHLVLPRTQASMVTLSVGAE